MTSSSSSSLVPRPLFGGAITIPLPADYLDASELRQVPDNQEVFLSSSSDTSVIVEILGMVDAGLASTDLWEAAKFHFESVAHDNAALSCTLLTPAPTSPIPSTPVITGADGTLPSPRPIVIAGIQKIHKFSHDPTGAPRPGHEADQPDDVWIGLALWRCWAQVGSTSKRADVVCTTNVNLSTDGGVAERAAVEAWWTRSIGDLKVQDWDLFGNEE